MSNHFSMNQNFDSDDEDEQQHLKSGRDGTIFVIDCSSLMFEKYQEDEEETCLFAKCLSVLERLLLNKIISTSKDLVGVVLYNTDKSPDPEGSFQMTENPLPVPNHCAILIPMQQIEAETIRYVKNLRKSEDFMDFNNKYGHLTDSKISDVLWLCSTMFSSSGKHIRIPQIMWYTNEDLPHQVGSNDHQQAFQKAKDLQQLQLDLQFYPMKEDFNGDLFYKELICQLLDLDMEDFPFPVPQLNERILLQRMFRRGNSKRAVCYLNVELSEKAKFGVGMYSFARSTFVPKPTKLTRDTNEEIVTKRAYKYGTVEDDGNVSASNVEGIFDYTEKLEPAMTKKYQQCGGEKICFTPLEAYEIKQVMEPKIKVLGFKPSSVLCERNHIRSPHFVYPSDSRIKNSAVFFRALWERCLAEDKVVICAFTMRLKSNPRLVALVPQEQSESEGDIIRYDGFRLVFIPFAGDIRDISEVLKAPEIVDDEITSLMKKIVGRLRIKFSATMFDNPVVKAIYGKIEEQLYDDDDPDEELTKDSTLPNLNAQDDRIDEYANKLEELVGSFEPEPKKAAKRKGSEEPGEAKKKKVEAEDINVELVLQKCESKDVKSLTVSTLRAYLSLKNFSGASKLNKAQLVEKILELGK